MLRKRIFTQTKSLTWGADTIVAEDIDGDSLITQIDACVEVTPSATIKATNQPDGPWRMIDNITIKGSSQTYFTLPAEQGGRLLHLLNLLDFPGRVFFSGQGVTAPELTHHPITFAMHFGSKPMVDGRFNPFDLSAFLPGYTDNLQIEWDTEGNDILDDAVTVSSAVMRLTLYVVQGTESEIRQEMRNQGLGENWLMTPSSEAEVFPTTAAKSDYSERRNLGTDAFLRRVVLLAQDATATRPLRANDEVTGVAIQLPGSGEELVKAYSNNLANWNPVSSFLIADDAVAMGHVTGATGFYPIDLRPHADPLYGLDLRNVSVGKVKLGMTIGQYASGDDVLIWQDRLLPNGKIH